MSKPALSSRLMGLKFMQRAAEKDKKAEATEAAEQRDAEAHWVIEGARTRCVVIAEGDPPPAEAAPVPAGSGAAGRLSFGGFNRGTEQLVADAAAAQAAAAAEAENPDGKAVSDEAMAATLRQQSRKGSSHQPQQQHEEKQAQGAGQQRSKHSGKHRGEGGSRQDRGGKHNGSGKQRGRQRDEEDVWGGGKKPRARYF